MPTANINCDVPGCDQYHVPNIPLLRKIYEHISSHPEEWDQSTWAAKIVKHLPRSRDALGRFIKSNPAAACETSFCVAGWAAQFTGYTIIWDKSGQCSCGCDDSGYTHTGDLVTMRSVNGDCLGISEVAAHELGLTNDETNLFAGSNDLAELRKMMEQIAARIGEEL